MGTLEYVGGWLVGPVDNFPMMQVWITSASTHRRADAPTSEK